MRLFITNIPACIEQVKCHTTYRASVNVGMTKSTGELDLSVLESLALVNAEHKAQRLLGTGIVCKCGDQWNAIAKAQTSEILVAQDKGMS